MSEHVILIVGYDPTLVNPQFLFEHVAELEGVESIKVKDGD